MTSPVIEDPRPASPAAIALAREALEAHWECFWFRADTAPLETAGDIHLVIRRLRQHGGRAAWDFAYLIEQCL